MSIANDLIHISNESINFNLNEMIMALQWPLNTQSEVLGRQFGRFRERDPTNQILDGYCVVKVVGTTVKKPN